MLSTNLWRPGSYERLLSYQSSSFITYCQWSLGCETICNVELSSEKVAEIWSFEEITSLKNKVKKQQWHDIVT